MSTGLVVLLFRRARSSRSLTSAPRGPRRLRQRSGVAALVIATAVVAAACLPVTSVPGDSGGSGTTLPTTTTTLPDTIGSTDDAGIWFAGDSVTAGYAKGKTPWPSFLEVEHRNVALGGLTIRQVKNHLLDLIEQDGAPDRIYVMAGINNIGLYGHGVPELIDQLLEFESEISVPVTWLTITPMRWINERRDEFNQWLRDNRSVIDCGDALGNPLALEYQWGDRVHLKNPDGHIALAACVEPLLL